MLTGQIRTPNPWTIEITNKFNHPKKSRKLLPSLGGGGWISRLYLLQDLFTNVSRSNFPQPAATTGWPGALRISFNWKKHHVVDDKLGQHCIASKVFYDVFLEVHNSMHAAHVFIFTCHVIGTPVLCIALPSCKRRHVRGRTFRTLHRGMGIIHRKVRRGGYAQEDFPETDGEQKVLCAKYQSKPKTSRCDQVDLWSCELCVCFLPVWFLRSKKRRHKISCNFWATQNHWLFMNSLPSLIPRTHWTLCASQTSWK